MFKIETLVKLVLCIALLLVGSAFGTETKSSDTAKGSGGSSPLSFNQAADHSARDEMYRADCVESQKMAKDKCDKLERLVFNDDSDPCSTAGKDFTIAKGELGDACGKAEIASEGGLYCAPALARCACANKSNRNKTVGGYTCQESTDILDTKDPLVRIYNYCPARAASDYDQIKQDKKEAEDKADTSEKAVPDKQKEVDDAQKANNKELQDVDNRVNKENDDYSKSQEDSKKNLNEAQQQIQQDLQNAEKHLGEINNQMRELELKKADATIAKGRMVTQAYLNCHAQAVAAGSKAMAEVAELIRGGALQSQERTKYV